MWRNLNFLHIWHVCDVENVSTYVQLCCFVAKSVNFAIYTVLSQNLFCRDLRAFAWRKIDQKIVPVEKKGQISCMYVYDNEDHHCNNDDNDEDDYDLHDEVYDDKPNNVAPKGRLHQV